MTLKQEQFIAKLPENGYNMAKTMRQVGYSEQSSRSGTLYASLRARMAKLYDPEVIKAKIVKVEKAFAKSGDNSNLARMIELQAKIAGLTKDQGNTQVTAIFPGVTDKAKQVIDAASGGSQQGIE